MNLGQLIGQLRMAAEPDGEGQKKTFSPKASRDSVIAFLHTNGSVGCGALAKGLGITSTHAAVALFALHSDGIVTRTGERGSYRYALTGVAE
jgi:predicted ArsR family transcriptional regulator